MKILVLSDSHGMLAPMEQAVSATSPDVIVHLGDYHRDAAALEDRFPDIPLVSVPGNCDFPGGDEPLTRVLQWEGVRVLITHGHRYGVKGGLLKLELAAREAEAQLALFGHTHRALCEDVGDLWLLNPGSCGYGFPTCGVVELEEGTVRCCTVEIADLEPV